MAPEEHGAVREVVPPPVEVADLTGQSDDPDRPGAEPEPEDLVVDAHPFIRTRPYDLRSGKK